MVLRAVELPQAFTALTFKVPEVNAPEKLIVTEVVPCPLASVALSGAVHR